MLIPSCYPYVLSDDSYFESVPPPRDAVFSHLERLAFGEDGFPERGAGGTSAEGRTAQRDLGFPTGDSGGAQRCCAPAPGDGRIPHGKLGLPPLYCGVAQG